jgi:hypothetical protein
MAWGLYTARMFIYGKTFRIPKKVQTKAINMLQDQKINVRPPAPVVMEKVESECLRRWEEGLPTDIEGVV